MAYIIPEPDTEKFKKEMKRLESIVADANVESEIRYVAAKILERMYAIAGTKPAGEKFTGCNVVDNFPRKLLVRPGQTFPKNFCRNAEMAGIRGNNIYCERAGENVGLLEEYPDLVFFFKPCVDKCAIKSQEPSTRSITS